MPDNNTVSSLFLTCPACGLEESLELFKVGGETSGEVRRDDPAYAYALIANTPLAECKSCGHVLDGDELVDFIESTLLYAEGE